MATDYYSILNVAQSATAEQIRAKFLELARSRHPDLFSGDEKAEAERQFQAITEAFNVLSDADRRRKLDQELSRPKATNTTSDPKQMVRVFMQRGAKSYKEGNYSAAAEEFERATRVDETNATAWYNMALACGRVQDQQSKAMSAIAKACELDRMNGPYLKLAGRLFLQGGMPLRAERYYRSAQRWLADDQEVADALARLRKNR